jgi:nitrate reductase (NAD(P)H)
MMPDYHIGTLDEASRKVLAQGQMSTESVEPRSIFLHPREWRKVLLHSKKKVSSDTHIFRFKLDHDEQTLGLPTGQHLMLRLRDPVTRESIIRSYTPISPTQQTGYCDILIKVYGDTPSRAGGQMTKALDALPLGHSLDVKGPIGKFEYLGRGLCSINGKEKRRVNRFYMICGGSGITPIYQVLRAVMQDREDATHCVVLYGNRTVDDILCREDLDVFARDNQDRCKVVHTLTKGNTDWAGRRGRIGEVMLKEQCIRGEGESMVLVCGPEALERATCQVLGEMGWTGDDIVVF